MSKRRNVTADLKSPWVRICEALNTDDVPDVARRLGLTRQTVYEWEKGKQPGVEALIKIAKEGGVSLHWLATGEGPKSLYVLSGADLDDVVSRARQSGITVEEQICELVREALEGETAVTNKADVLEPLLQLIDTLPKAKRRAIAMRLKRDLLDK